MGDVNDPWDYRRITAAELQELPETFSIDDVPQSIRQGHRDVLLVNNGCWLCDMRRPCWDQRDELGRQRLFFDFWDRITRLPDGRRSVEFVPEDWLFSRYCHAAGAKVVATKAVHCNHFGENKWTVDTSWGTLLTDTEAESFHELMRPFRGVSPAEPNSVEAMRR